MKVAMIGHKVVPSRRGGIEKVLTTLCPLMAEAGEDVCVYNRMGDKVENEYVSEVFKNKYKGVKLKKAFTFKLRGISAMLASHTGALAAAFSNCDIVHFHAEGPCAAMWIPKLFGKKCVATVHGLDWQREKWGKGFASKYIKFGERMLVKYADEIIVLSENAKAYFKETYGRETNLIYNGADEPVIKEADKITEAYGIKKDSYICIISRLTEEKGVHYLIDAYNSIKTDKKLVIAGDTSDTDDYVALLKEKAKDNENIIFTGFISGRIIEEMYSNAYAVCLPSDLEGMSLSLLEALAYGNAVVLSDIKENSAVAEDRALYFKHGNTADLAEKLEFICSDSGFKDELKSRVSGFIINKYNWKDVRDKTLELYRKALKK